MLATTPLPRTIIDAAHAISVPRREVANSFVLHAPLELMGRVGLLAYLEPSTRDDGIAKIAELAATYTATGPAVTPPPDRHFDSCSGAARALVAAIAASDLDDVDATMAWLTQHANPAQLRLLLGEAVVDSL